METQTDFYTLFYTLIENLRKNKPSQKERILTILQDYLPHSNYEITQIMYPSGKAGLFRLGARVWDLQKEGWIIKGWHDAHIRGKYWYQITGIQEIDDKTLP